MKILKLTAENIKRLKVVEIKPSGEIVEITGRNAQGKTSVLDSIWWALAGTSHIQTQPIRKGEKKARIRLDLGELIVERRFNEHGSTLFVESVAGARFPSPQTMLDELLGALSFDPLAFARMEPREQYNALRKTVKLSVDTDLLDGQNAADFAKRTDVNRDAKALRARAEAIIFPVELPDAPVDETTLLNDIQKAGEENAEIEARKARREKASEEIKRKHELAVYERNAAANNQAEAEKHMQTAKERAAKANSYDAEAAELEAKLKEAGPLPQPVDVGMIRRSLDAAKSVNAGVTKRSERAKLTAEAEALEKNSAALSEKIIAREQAKQDAIRSAKMPVEGLGFGTGRVEFNGVPLEQTASSEQLRISLAIAMAANPKLRVIRIMDGSLLDSASLKQIANSAKENDYQIWIERVDESGKIGVVIEDGSVARVN
jgi:DNA repair exonuclease SbcCD ATPase subunit